MIINPKPFVTFFFLISLFLYLTSPPSYIHPDEHFQTASPFFHLWSRGKKKCDLTWEFFEKQRSIASILIYFGRREVMIAFWLLFVFWNGRNSVSKHNIKVERRPISKMRLKEVERVNKMDRNNSQVNNNKIEKNSVVYQTDSEIKNKTSGSNVERRMSLSLKFVLPSILVFSQHLFSNSAETLILYFIVSLIISLLNHYQQFTIKSNYNDNNMANEFIDVNNSNASNGVNVTNVSNQSIQSYDECHYFVKNSTLSSRKEFGINIRFFILGMLSAFGFWTRFSFAFSLITIIPFILYISLIFFKISAFYFYLLGGVCVGGLLTIIDSIYYHSIQNYNILEIAPINNLLYNMNTNNLALHTLHPKYLHILVNLPMLFGPFGVYVAISIVKKVLLFLTNFLKKPLQISSIRQLHEVLKKYLFEIFMSSLFISYLTVFSLAPHQEMRFLLPLAVPISALSKKFYESASNLTKRILISTFIIHGIAFVLILGYIHQAGVIPSLKFISNEINSGSTKYFTNNYPIRIVYSNTYLPPNYILNQDITDNRIMLYDTKSDLENFKNIIGNLSLTSNPIYIVHPKSFNFPNWITSNPNFINEKVTCIFPHLSTEYLPKSIGDLCLEISQIR